MAQQNQNQQDLREILQIRRDKLAALQEAGRNPFEITRYDVTHHAQEVKDQFDQLEGQTVSLAGRLMSKRGMGKVSFCDLKDKSGRIQIYARKDEMDEEAYVMRLCTCTALVALYRKRSMKSSVSCICFC